MNEIKIENLHSYTEKEIQLLSVIESWKLEKCNYYDEIIKIYITSTVVDETYSGRAKFAIKTRDKILEKLYKYLCTEHGLDKYTVQVIIALFIKNRYELNMSYLTPCFNESIATYLKNFESNIPDEEMWKVCSIFYLYFKKIHDTFASEELPYGDFFIFPRLFISNK